MGGVRQQFSMMENIEMSMFGANFLRHSHRQLYVHGQDQPDINYQPHGYLFLASENGMDQMEKNHETQM